MIDCTRAIALHTKCVIACRNRNFSSAKSDKNLPVRRGFRNFSFHCLAVYLKLVTFVTHNGLERIFLRCGKKFDSWPMYSICRLLGPVPYPCRAAPRYRGDTPRYGTAGSRAYLVYTTHVRFFQMKYLCSVVLFAVFV